MPCSPLSDDARHERLDTSTDVLPHLECENLGRAHLHVEELDDAPEFGRDLVRHEHESYAARLQVRLDGRPEAVRVVILHQVT